MKREETNNEIRVLDNLEWEKEKLEKKARMLGQRIEQMKNMSTEVTDTSRQNFFDRFKYWAMEELNLIHDERIELLEKLNYGNYSTFNPLQQDRDPLSIREQIIQLKSFFKRVLHTDDIDNIVDFFDELANERRRPGGSITELLDEEETPDNATNIGNAN